MTRRGAYSLRAVLCLARHFGRRRRKPREIAADTNIPPNYLPQILANMKRHRLLRSTAGKRGGSTLSRSSAELSLLDVIEAAEGPLRPLECELRRGPCGPDRGRPLHHVWARAVDAPPAELASTSFAELAEADALSNEGTCAPVGRAQAASVPGW